MILRFPDFKKDFDTDASDSGIGAVLSQKQDGIEHVMLLPRQVKPYLKPNVTTDLLQVMSYCCVQGRRKLVLHLYILCWVKDTNTETMLHTVLYISGQHNAVVAVDIFGSLPTNKNDTFIMLSSWPGHNNKKN